MFTIYDLLLVKIEYLTCTMLKETETIKCKEAITNKENAQRDGNVEIKDQLIFP